MAYLAGSWRRSASGILLLCALLVAAADWLFYKQPIGWTPALFGFMFVGAVLLRPGHALRSRAALALLLTIMILAVALLLHRSVIAVVMMALAAAMLALTRRSGWRADASAWVRRLARLALGGPVAIFRDFLLTRRFVRRHGRRTLHFAAIVLTWTVPVAFSLTFLGLLAAANPVISAWVRELRHDVATMVNDVWRHVGLWRVVLWCAVACGAWALLRCRAGRMRPRDQAHAAASALSHPVRALFNPTAVTRSLLIFNAMFAIQTVLDVYFLFGGGSLPEGMTYAEYAHRGAYPLVATALLAGVFTLIAFRDGGVEPDMRLARRLVVLWVLQNVFLTITAAWRLWLYVDAYSLTRWRIAAAIWMLLVALGLLWLIARIVSASSNRWLMNANALTAAVVMGACGFIPFDELLASFNATHCREVRGRGEPLDLKYFERLGSDALPAARRLRNDGLGNWSSGTLDGLVARLERRLDERLANWRGWTWRDAMLRESRALAMAPQFTGSDTPGAEIVLMAQPRASATSRP